MKKIAVLLLAAVFLFLAGCETQTVAPAATDPSDIVTQAPTEAYVPAEFQIYSLKGPTSMGLVKLLDDNANGICANSYTSNMVTGADEVTAALINKTADIAMLPANAAATLYNKAGGFKVIAINTLGVLYLIENANTVQSVDDLAGKTVYLTGKGTTPEYALRYLLAAHGIEDQVTLEFKTEATEVVTALTEDIAAIGLLPQPFATAALVQNQQLRIALDLTQEWADVNDESNLITGVTVVRDEILEKYPDQVNEFLKEYSASIVYVNENPAQAATWIEALGIVAKAAIAEKALPYCNLVCITAEQMQTALSGYLQVLYSQNPDAVGGSMPDEAFYYLAP